LPGEVFRFDVNVDVDAAAPATIKT